MNRRRPIRVPLDGGAVLFVEESRALPLVSIVVSLRSAASHDPVDKAGLARVMGRMLRRGCEGLGAVEIEEAIDALGGEMGVDVSQSTMSVHAQVIRRNLAPFVDLLARIVGTPELREEELEHLKRQSIAELIGLRDRDRSLAQAAFRRSLFAGHPYARSVAGQRDSLDRIHREDVRAFHRAHFVRGNIVVGFAGDVSAEEAAPLATRLISALPAGARVEDTVGPPPPPKGRKLVLVDKPNRKLAHVVLGSLGTSPHDPDHFDLMTAVTILGGTFSSRLMREVRSKRGWSYGASASLAIERQRQAFWMATSPSASNAPPCVALKLDLLEELVTAGVTRREVSFVTQYLVRAHAFDVDTASKRLHEALDVELLGLPEDYYSSYVERVRRVTAASASEALRRRLDPEALVIAVVGTASETEEKLRAAIPRLSSCEIVPFDRD
ncbi:MAG: pitrilysin family protein [Minicystis sp.]